MSALFRMWRTPQSAPGRRRLHDPWRTCFGIGRWFLRTKAATDFCRYYWVRTGEVLEIGDPLWRRAMQLWELEQYAGADGLELFERVMSELA